MSRKLTWALMLLASVVPTVTWAQAPCACSPRSASVIRPASHELWADYDMGGGQAYGGCNSCRNYGNCGPGLFCNPCRPPLACIIPNTLRKIGRSLDCLLPCGPRSGHGCGLSCIGAGSGCSSLSCCGCNSCTNMAPHTEMIGSPFLDDPAPPAPPQPMTKETRHQNPQPNRARSQSVLSAQASASKKSAAKPIATKIVASKPLTTKSVMTKPASTKVASKKVKATGTGVQTAEHVAPIVTKKQLSVLKKVSVETNLVPVEPAPLPEESTRPSEPTKLLDFEIPHNPLR